MESLTILMPDGLLSKLHDVANRRGLHMGDMLVELCWNLVQVDAADTRNREPE